MIVVWVGVGVLVVCVVLLGWMLWGAAAAAGRADDASEDLAETLRRERDATPPRNRC